jgi:quercetin dioxygenase-like cupin family protein
MKMWQLDSVSAHSDQPTVLFSNPQARGVIIHLDAGQELGRHQVRERAIIHVISGETTFDCDSQVTHCGPTSLLVFEPNETHSIRATTAANLLMILAPWPAPDHYSDGAVDHDPQQLPKNATGTPSTDT